MFFPENMYNPKVMKNILIIGGAGYIGSVCTKLCCDAGYKVSVIDNLSTGYQNQVDKRARFAKVDILNRDAFFEYLSANKFDAVIHLAAHKNASESMENPMKYLDNIKGTINVLDGMRKFKIPKIVFSSTAAVYGNPEYLPVDEKHKTEPINYYGETKLICERFIEQYSKIHKISFVIFRYFNVVGDIGLKFIERAAHNLFPAIQDVISGNKDQLEIYGNDYETLDGTCVRDYIHVADIANAHLIALTYNKSDIFNLGTNNGYSVMEIVKAFGKALSKKLPIKFVKKRVGDPAALIADAAKANDNLNWKAEKGLEEMVASSLF